MINKLFPRKLNRSLDSRLRSPEDMIDAINVVIGDEFSQSGSDADSTMGDVGVIKPVVSNRGIDYNSDIDALPADREVKIIGSVSDDQLGVIYFFVWCSFASAQGVYAYDARGALMGSQGECVRKVFTHAQFNFPENGFVKGDVVHTGEGFDYSFGDFKYEKDRKSIVYFTDNVNEPRKISVFRAMASNFSNYNQYDFADFITACPKTPVHPITFNFFSDPSKLVSNFKNVSGLQFAYQHLYIDDEESAISVYSDIAVPPAYIQQGSLNNPFLMNSNGCRLTIPSSVLFDDDNNASQVRSKEIKKVRVLAREGNDGAFFIIDEIEVDNQDNIVFDFFNDKVVIPAPPEDVQKQFDNVPRASEAQAIVSDRLFYGNYLENYDPIDTNVDINPVYHTRPKDFTSLSLKATPEVFSLYHNASSSDGPDDPDNIPDRVAGFRIDTSELPESIAANVIINVEIICNPDNHLHLYNAEKSFHGNRFAFGDGVDVFPSGKIELASNTVSETYAATEYSDVSSSDKAIIVPPVFGENSGVSFLTSSAPNSIGGIYPKWDVQGSEPGLMGEFDAVYGTSAANPLIIKGDTMSFGCSILCTEAITSNVRSKISNAVTIALTSNSTLSLPQGIEVLSGNQSYSYPFNLDIQDGQTITSSVEDGLENLITAVGRKTRVIDNEVVTSTGIKVGTGGFPTGFNPNHTDEPKDFRLSLPPCGYFLVSKGTVTAELRDINVNVKDYLIGEGQEFLEDAFVAIDISSIDVEQEDIMTCIPKMQGEFMSKINTENSANPLGSYQVTALGSTAEGHGVLNPYGSGDLNPNNAGGIWFFEAPYARIKSWSFYSPSYIQSNGGEIYDELDPFLKGKVVEDSAFLSLIENTMYTNTANANQNYDAGSKNALNDLYSNTYDGYLNNNELTNEKRRVVGYLKINNELGPKLYTSLSDRVDVLSEDDDTYNLQNGGITILDGQGGPLWNFNVGGSSVSDAPGGAYTTGSIGASTILQGNGGGSYFITLVRLLTTSGETTTPAAAPGIPEFPVMALRMHNNSAAMLAIPNSRINNYSAGYGLNITDAKIKSLTTRFVTSGGLIQSEFNDEKYSEIEILSFNYSTVSNDSVDRSFKTSANHDWAMRYSDERGRLGPVMPLDSVYVAGYYDSVRNGKKGRVSMQFQLNHIAPDWAHNYHILYAGNSSVQDFQQYSAGGAFVAADSDNDEGNIYVSLNYLQENTNVSYAEAFGAVSPAGDKDLYTFNQGDQLRIISYAIGSNPQDRIYPTRYEFEIIDVVNLIGNSADENILYDEQESDTPAKQGQFLVLKDNINAFGFTYADVKGAGGDIDTDFHKWNNTCVVEMFSPQKAQDFEDRIYYEIATTGNIVKNILGLGNTTLTHSPNSFEIEGGDVWWRRIPLNTAEFAEDDEDEGVDLYRNLIQDEDSVPRFKDFFVESMAFNDTFARNNVYFYGRPGIYLPNEKEIRRRASLTFSDKNNYATSISRFTSFNKSKLNFKDIPNEYGSINYLLNNYDSLFVVQEDKASAIPISRQILETALGQEQVTVSSQIVGTQRFFSGDYGTDNNPESVCKVGNDIYFAHKSNHQVYKFNPSSGIQVISNMGMNSFFVELFRSAEATEGKVRVVGGYDPLKDEFLITVYNQDESDVFNIEFVEQPIGIDLTAAPDIDDEVDDDEGDIQVPDTDDDDGGDIQVPDIDDEVDDGSGDIQVPG